MTTPKLAADNPITHSAEDTLGRASSATRFADEILGLDASEGIVVGVLGAWGSGKTSFVNLARERFEERGARILDFNPWMFSGAEQLVTSFFVEVAAQLRLQPGLAEIGKGLEDYGEAFSGLGWLPLVGPWIERGRLANKAVARLLQRRKEGIGARRLELTTALAHLKSPIVIVLDDIDRLATNEIRDVFKLVRLTASFPNVIYVVVFDRPRVELALTEEGVPGRVYLEKILQVGVDLPAIPERILTAEIFKALDEALASLATVRALDEQAWPDVFMEIVRPLIRNLRDVRRYSAAARASVGELGAEIQLADVLALEAVRVFLPDVFARLHLSVTALTAPAPSFGSRDSPEHQETIAALVNAAGDRGDVVRQLIYRLFPAAQRHLPGGSHYDASWTAQWLRERRVAHEDILRLYLERVAGAGLRAFWEAERAWELFADREALDQFLRSLNRDRLEDVIGALEAYEHEFRPEHVVPATTVLLNLSTELPDRPRGMLEMETRFVVGRVVYRLLRACPDSAAVDIAAEQILPGLKSLSAQLELITDIGYREGAGHKLASEATATRLEADWRKRVREATPDQLALEADLARVLFIVKRDTVEGEEGLSIDSSPDVTLALLRSSLTYVRSQSVGSRAVRRSPRLPWDGLIDLYGDEQTLRVRIDELEATAPSDADEVLAIAKEYAGGWRPNEFGDDD